MSCAEYYDAQSIYFSPTKMLYCITLFGKDPAPFNVTLSKGTYIIELWGAAGGASTHYQTNEGGYGGYSSGLLTLYSQETFIFEVGTKGGDTPIEGISSFPGVGGYNGGADGGNDTFNGDCSSGGSGGSTDMRINSSISGRIIVAGGGGSGGCYYQGGKGGNGGGLSGTKGFDSESGIAIGGSPGTQTSGHEPLNGERGSYGDESGGSGGGGYWGGKSGGTPNITEGTGYDVRRGGAGGGGGSSFISGHPDCIPVEPYIFKNPITISGENLMPSNSSFHEYVVGNTGNGSVRITSFSTIITCSHQKHHIKSIIF